MFANVICKPQSSILSPNILAESSQTRDPKTLHFGGFESRKAIPLLSPHTGESNGKKMQDEMETLGPFKGVYRDIPPCNGELENELETGVV